MALYRGNRGANVVGVAREVNRMDFRNYLKVFNAACSSTQSCVLPLSAIGSETMSSQGVGVPLQQDASRTMGPTPDLADYPVREYVTSMARELARMARWDGDEALAGALEAASTMASGPTK
jgi:hypothetical protein